MSILDELLKAGVSTANSTILETRSNVNRNLTSMVINTLPKTNRIPGPLGGFAENLKNRTASALTNPITNLMNVGLQMGTPVKKVGDGVNQVFNAVGVPSDTPIKQANPRVYQNASSAAVGIWEQIDAKADPSKIVANAQESLTLLKFTHDEYVTSENRAYKSPVPLNTGQRPTPYAMDLFRLAPKHKFLFVVEFVFNGGYDFIGAGQRNKNDFAVTIRDFDRPNVTYEYEEGVNFYNFRTPVIKKVVHEPVTMKFLDDRQNLAMQFFHNYLKATNPLSNVNVESAASFESNGMNINSPLYSGSVGVLKDDLITILREIKVYHIYDFGAKMNIHHFINPKFVSFEHDSWNMVDSEGSYITTKFVYDSWHMELGIDIGEDEALTIGTLSDSGTYKMHPMQTSAPQGKDSLLQQSLSPGEEIVSPSSLRSSLNPLASLDPGEEFVTKLRDQIPKGPLGR